jgi:hypothetical protein
MQPEGCKTRDDLPLMPPMMPPSGTRLDFATLILGLPGSPHRHPSSKYLPIRLRSYMAASELLDVPQTRYIMPDFD